MFKAKIFWPVKMTGNDVRLKKGYLGLKHQTLVICNDYTKNKGREEDSDLLIGKKTSKYHSRT